MCGKKSNSLLKENMGQAIYALTMASGMLCRAILMLKDVIELASEAEEHQLLRCEALLRTYLAFSKSKNNLFWGISTVCASKEYENGAK